MQNVWLKFNIKKNLKQFSAGKSLFSVWTFDELYPNSGSSHIDSVSIQQNKLTCQSRKDEIQWLTEVFFLLNKLSAKAFDKSDFNNLVISL